MRLIEILLMAIGTAMDALAVSLGIGLSLAMLRVLSTHLIPGLV